MIERLVWYIWSNLSCAYHDSSCMCFAYTWPCLLLNMSIFPDCVIAYYFLWFRKIELLFFFFIFSFCSFDLFFFYCRSIFLLCPRIICHLWQMDDLSFAILAGLFFSILFISSFHFIFCLCTHFFLYSTLHPDVLAFYGFQRCFSRNMGPYRLEYTFCFQCV